MLRLRNNLPDRTALTVLEVTANIDPANTAGTNRLDRAKGDDG
jgi:hypothetical protein